MKAILFSVSQQQAVIDWLLDCRLVAPVGVLDPWSIGSSVSCQRTVSEAVGFFVCLMQRVSRVRTVSQAEVQQSNTARRTRDYPTLLVDTVVNDSAVVNRSQEESASCYPVWLLSEIEMLLTDASGLQANSSAEADSQVSKRPVARIPKRLQQSTLDYFLQLTEDTGQVNLQVDEDLDAYTLVIPDQAESQRSVKVIKQLIAGLLDQLDRQRQRLDDKLSAMKQLGYGASHEFNNPLANIATRAQTLARDEVSPDRKHMLQVINAQAFRGFDMLANLMHFSAPPIPQHQSVDLSDSVQQGVAETQRFLASEFDVDFQFGNRLEGETTILADPQHMLLLWKSIARNAIEAGGAIVKVSLELCQMPDGADGIEVQFEDSGAEVSPQLLLKMADPFFSGREAGRGLGFGLSLCYQIVRQHRGQMILQALEPAGLRVFIRLPRENAGFCSPDG